MTSPTRVLVVDDEPDLRTLYELTLVREGHDVDTAGSLAEAWERLDAGRYSVLITDMRLPDGLGIELLRGLEAAARPERCLVITAYGSAENAVEALKAGAFDYLTKPVDLKQLRGVVAAAVSAAQGLAQTAAQVPGASRPAAPPVASTAQSATPQAAQHPALQRLAGQTAAMQQVRALIQKVASGMAPVLVQGESGTGKELVARAIHETGSRAAGPFVAVNCGAIPEHLLEAEFFGVRKGAFTGAHDDRPGFFQAAQGGTLFLDEIGDLPLAMQSKLLRVIQERVVRPLGAVAELPLNVRLVSATHKDLAAAVQDNRFRQDLYYRLNVIQIRMPPLRERLDDLAQICRGLLERIARDAGVSPPPHLSEPALALLATHAFPGNVRELENLLHRAVALTGAERIEAPDLGLVVEAGPESAEAFAAPAEALAPGAPGAASTSDVAEALAPLPSDLVAHLDQVEREILLRALEAYRHNRTAAGASLGLSLRQMRYRMARLGIQVDQVSD